MTAQTTSSTSPAGAGAGVRSARLRQVEEGLFFIVGCGRSGTTLLQSMLCCGDSVTIPPETKYYSALAAPWRRLPDPSYERRFDGVVDFLHAEQRMRGVQVDRETLRAFADEAERSWDGLFLALLAAYAERVGAERIGEKSPVHTHHMDHLEGAFPRARFVHMLRDPRAVILSRVRSGFTSRAIAPAIEWWRAAARMHERYADRLGPERYRVVRYEELVTDPEPVLRDLCAFLGVEFTQDMLTHHEKRKYDKVLDEKPHHANLARPVFTSSIEKWRKELTPGQLGLIETALRREMALMGYESTGATARLVGPRLAFSNGLWRLTQGVGVAERGVRKLLRGGGVARPANDEG